MIQRLLLVAAALVAMSALAAGAGLLWLRSSLPVTEGTTAVSGLSQAVEIVRDAHGVPHIFAENSADGYFALGYAHAQDRLFQMEYLRRLASGRLAEAVGPAAVPVDRFMRVLGLRHLAEEDTATAPKELLDVLEAYAAGVNAFLADRRGSLPLSFIVLGRGRGLSPEPWQPVDSLLWGRLMGFQLSVNWRSELLRARMLARLPAERVAELFPAEPADAPTTLPPAGRAAENATPLLRTNAVGNLPLDSLWHAIPEELASRSASNAWAIAGSLTRSGSPILANDPHLGLRTPGIWYLARIVTPAGEIAGATVPGVPLHVIGHNGRLAWGMTTVGADVSDLFVERLAPKKREAYLTPAGERPFESRVERIEVRGEAPVVTTIRRSRHGPVLSDVLPPGTWGTDEVLSLASTALASNDRTAHALLRINRSTSASAFLAAAVDFHSPMQNLFFATIDGDIGVAARARVPVRSGGDGRLPSPGHDGSHAWTGLVPPENLPTALNPPSGILVNANNRLVDDDYPFHIAHDWDYGFRAARIEEVLAAGGFNDIDASAALQHDVVSPVAHLLLPVMSEVVRRTELSPRATEALSLLTGWDGGMRRSDPEPLIFTAWLYDTVRALAADELGPLYEDYADLRPRFVHLALTEATHWCNDVTTVQVEDCPTQVAAALDRALAGLKGRFGATMSAWRWGDAHRAHFPHLVLTHVPVLRRLADNGIATDGDDFTVNRGQMAGGTGDDPFRHVHGAGLKAVYDLADLSRSRFMIAPGQSGNPLSRHYDDLLAPWRDGRYIRLAGDRAALSAAGGRVHRLVPSD